MTPMLHRLLKRAVTDKKRDVLRQFDEVKSFELSGVAPLFRDLVEKFGENIKQKSFDGRLAFLPAPVTWIEWDSMGDILELTKKHPLPEMLEVNSSRAGFLLLAKPYEATARTFEYSEINGEMSFIGDGTLALLADKPSVRFDYQDNEMPSKFRARLDSGLIAIVYAALALINSPRVIGRRQHMPHRGLEKQLLASKVWAGTFPLQAWTEIILHCTPPKDMGSDDVSEAHLTGHRCLHFCRAHLRFRNGCLEFVRSHWRGDPALGMKQSRYVVTP